MLMLFVRVYVHERVCINCLIISCFWVCGCCYHLTVK